MSKLNFSCLKNGSPMPSVRQVDRSGIVSDLWEFYLDSTTSLLADLEAAAISLERGDNIEEDAANIRRILHSIKGDSGVSGLGDVYAMCHQAEGVFETLRDDPAAAADMVLRVKDWITSVIQYISNGEFREESHTPAEETDKLRALVIDDDSLCRKRIEMIISPFFNCTFANNGYKGIDLFEKALDQGQPYDLVTLDINMPGLDGHNTLEAIRCIEKQRGVEGLDGVKIIMSTSCDESSCVFSAFRKGCEAYVIKREMGEKLPDQMVKLGLLKITPSYSLK